MADGGGDSHNVESSAEYDELFQLKSDATSPTSESQTTQYDLNVTPTLGRPRDSFDESESFVNETNPVNKTAAVQSNGEIGESDPLMPHNDATISDEGGAAAAAAAAADDENHSLPFLPDIEALIARDREVIRRLQEERLMFMRKMEQAEAEVHRVAEHLYGLVDNKTNEMLSTASSVRTDRLAEFDRTRTELESSISSMRVNQDFVVQALDGAGPREVLQFAPAVQRMSEQFKREEERARDFSRTAFEDDRIDALNAFAQMDVASWATNAGGNLLGRVTTSESVEAAVDAGCTVPYLSEAQSLGVLTAGSRVQGLTFLENCLYVLLERCATVDVYDVATMNAIDQIVVEQLTFPDRIVGSEAGRCVFVSDAQVSGLFRLSQFPDIDVSLLPLPGIPAGLAVSSSGHLAFVFMDSKTVHMASVENVSITKTLSVSDLCRPVSAMPVPGDDNGVVVCSETDQELQWFLCGHKLGTAAAARLEEPVQLYSLNNICYLIPDSYGMYIGLNAVCDNIVAFDASFCVNRSLLKKSEDCHDMSCVALDSHSGKLAVGCRNGVIIVLQVMQTRKRIEVHLRKWT